MQFSRPLRDLLLLSCEACRWGLVASSRVMQEINEADTETFSTVVYRRLEVTLGNNNIIAGLESC